MPGSIVGMLLGPKVRRLADGIASALILLAMAIIVGYTILPMIPFVVSLR